MQFRAERPACPGARRYAKGDLRPAVILNDVAGADFDRVKLQHAAGLPDAHRDTRIDRDRL